VNARAASPSSLKPLDDTELSSVNGHDGLAFNIAGFSLSPGNAGTTTLTYAMPGSTAAHPYTLTLSNFALSRTDDASPFTDPYYLDIVQRLGASDVIQLAFPKNANLTQLWNFSTDLGIVTDAVPNVLDFSLGNLALKNLGLQGGGLDISTPATPGVQGVAFGLSLKVALDSFTLRPRGAADSTEMLSLSGVKLASTALAADGVTYLPWALTDVTRQPGLFNAITESNPDGTTSSYLHLQIGWPTDADPAPTRTASLSIDRIAFTSNGSTVDLGASRVGGIQINYMDIKFRPGP
jgi:hypothetical protein